MLLHNLLDVRVHSVDVSDAEARSEDRYLHLVAEIGVETDTPLDFEVGTELLHEVVHLVHLLHHEAAG